MITLITGANSYEADQVLKQLVAEFNGEPERFDGADLELSQMPDILMGISLFSTNRLVIIRDLSENKSIWEVLPGQIEHMSDDIHLVLVEPSVDKRTKTYKTLQKQAEVKGFSLLTERDSMKAEQWLLAEAKNRGVGLDKPAAQEILRRSLLPAERGQPIIDQWQAVHTLEKLAVLGDITLEAVKKYTDTQPVDSVFGLFETALKGDRAALHQLLADLEPREDPFRVFGLLSGQVFQLAVFGVSDEPSGDTAKAIGVHPFVASKLSPMAKRLQRSQLRQIVAALTEADEAMKTSKGTPWLLIEQALMKIASQVGAAK